MAKPKKKIVYEHLENISPYEFDTSLASLQKKIQEWIDEYGPDAYLDWDRYHHEPYDTEPSPRFNLKRNREETDQEYNQRIALEKQEKEVREKREREEYERLQAKFGKTK